MARVLIIYKSKTGNTEKMALAVEEGLKQEGVEVTKKRIEVVQVDDLLGYDGIIIGTPTYFAAMAAEIKKLVDESIKVFGKLEGKVGAAFATSGDLGGGAETALLDILRSFLVHGMIVPGSTSGGHYGPISVGAPNEERVETCRKFGSRIGKWVTRLQQ